MKNSNKQLCDEQIKHYETEIAFLTTHNEYLHYSIKRCIDILKNNYLIYKNKFIMDNENIIKENNKRLDCFNYALKSLKEIDDM
jgi:molybdopterin synthase catalytic subunit